MEIENLLNYNYLDIEFALVNNEVYILQVRPLIIRDKECNENIINQYLDDSISEIKSFFEQNKQIYSLMSDWNPAEETSFNLIKQYLQVYYYRYKLVIK